MSDPVREALKESMDRNDMWSALEKPKWTSGSPKEPNWYFGREMGIEDSLFIASIKKEYGELYAYFGWTKGVRVPLSSVKDVEWSQYRESKWHHECTLERHFSKEEREAFEKVGL